MREEPVLFVIRDREFLTMSTPVGDIEVFRKLQQKEIVGVFVEWPYEKWLFGNSALKCYYVDQDRIGYIHAEEALDSNMLSGNVNYDPMIEAMKKSFSEEIEFKVRNML